MTYGLRIFTHIYVDILNYVYKSYTMYILYQHRDKIIKSRGSILTSS